MASRMMTPPHANTRPSVHQKQAWYGCLDEVVHLVLLSIFFITLQALRVQRGLALNAPENMRLVVSGRLRGVIPSI